MYSVYILYSNTIDKFYIGYSINVKKRICYHNSQDNSIWTKRGKPWEVFTTIDGLTERQAIAIEKHIKRMKSKVYISNLIKYPEISEKLKEKYS